MALVPERMDAFLKAWQSVFDDHGRLLVCGKRNAYILISSAEQLDPVSPVAYYGLKDIGYVHEAQMKELYFRVMAHRLRGMS